MSLSPSKRAFSPEVTLNYHIINSVKILTIWYVILVYPDVFATCIHSRTISISLSEYFTPIVDFPWNPFPANCTLFFLRDFSIAKLSDPFVPTSSALRMLDF